MVSFLLVPYPTVLRGFETPHFRLADEFSTGSPTPPPVSAFPFCLFNRSSNFPAKYRPTLPSHMVPKHRTFDWSTIVRPLSTHASPPPPTVNPFRFRLFHCLSHSPVRYRPTLPPHVPPNRHTFDWLTTDRPLLIHTSLLFHTAKSLPLSPVSSFTAFPSWITPYPTVLHDSRTPGLRLVDDRPFSPDPRFRPSAHDNLFPSSLFQLLSRSLVSNRLTRSPHVHRRSPLIGRRIFNRPFYSPSPRPPFPFRSFDCLLYSP